MISLSGSGGRMGKSFISVHFSSVFFVCCIQYIDTAHFKSICNFNFIILLFHLFPHVTFLPCKSIRFCPCIHLNSRKNPPNLELFSFLYAILSGLFLQAARIFSKKPPAARLAAGDRADHAVILRLTSSPALPLPRPRRACRAASSSGRRSPPRAARPSRPRS